jgi:DNA-directed RNA polymerase I, II, and III subunit RPABC5
MDTIPIPVKCVTCGMVLADKYKYFVEEVRRRKLETNNSINDEELKLNKVIYLTKTYNTKTHEGEVLDKIGLNKMCCRRHMITKV